MTTETVKAVLSKRDRRINAELEAMSIPLDSPEAHNRRDRFLGTATAANVALAEVALLETRSAHPYPRCRHGSRPGSHVQAASRPAIPRAGR